MWNFIAFISDIFNEIILYFFQELLVKTVRKSVLTGVLVVVATNCLVIVNVNLVSLDHFVIFLVPQILLDQTAEISASALKIIQINVIQR